MKQDFFLGDVQLLDDYEVNAFAREVDYLKSLDADKLLRGFCDIAGITWTSPLYGGWETSAIQGHTLGHYLTAVSQSYAVTRDEELLQIINHMVDVLAQCQNPETGYLAAIPEDHYVRIENGNTSGTWVPWYSMHKILAGLVDTYEKAGSKKGLEVASKLGDWVYSRTSKWTPEMQTTVLNVEYGGMNDCLYQLYKNTKSEKHLQAAHSFDELRLFDALYDGKDILNGKHANTTIPKIVGAVNRYLALGEGEEYYLQAAENFWDIVVNNHTYITGGNSEWEHFGLPKILDAERTNCTCETCNTYNMLKLSKGLFQITGKKKYADYYENTFINAILSSQNPETGMTTYFQPMATGFFKVYSSPFDHFWCCTGSGMENFSKLGDSIYFKDENSVYVTQFVSSKLTWKEKGLIITQSSNIPNSDTTTFIMETISDEKVEATLVLRIPDWCEGKVSLYVNGATALGYEVADGFVKMRGNWRSGDVVEYKIPMSTVAYGLPDNERVVAFKYGPVVLSADLGTEDMKTSTTGVNVTIPTKFVEINEVITVTDEKIADWLSKVNENVVREGNDLKFTLKGTDRKLAFYPHYLQYKNRYGIYFKMADADTVAEEEKQEKYVVIDSLPVANDQYEFSHNLVAELSTTGSYKGYNYRHAAPEGYFGYDLAVENGVTNYLKVKYCSDDAGRKFTIYIDGEVLERAELSNENPGAFFDAYYKIPYNKTEEGKKISIRFVADHGCYAGGIFDRIATVKEKK